MKTNSEKTIKRVKREQISSAQLLMFITIGIFICMYASAIFIWGGAYERVQNLFDMLNNNAALIIIACSLTVVMIGGGIDISVGGVVALTVMSCCVHLQSSGSILTTVLLALGIGLMFGIVQGYLISYLEIQPFIVTLAGMFFARGMITIVSEKPVKVAHEGFKALMNSRISITCLGYTAKKGNWIPARMEYGVIIALAIVILIFILLQKTKLGRDFYAIGGNSQSALMLGVNVKLTKFLSFVISGLLAGIAGFVFMMHTGSGNATNATAAEMDAIASSIIGGTLLSGGAGNVIGTFFGVLTLSTIKSIVMTSGLRDPWWQSITTGAMLCFFILLQSVILTIRANSNVRSAIRIAACNGIKKRIQTE